ncbi:MAG: RNA polymerase sporulation sigma factor SigK [Clostridia bacterium]|nr:RNA polymerase sporulation sigma factor SigK [Clostridia bacterium]
MQKTLKEKLISLFKRIFFKNNLEIEEKLIAYVCGGEALPLALTQEEELELINRLANKDENAKNLLIEHNLRLVVYIAKKFDNTGTDLEDLISVGAIGLVKAVQSFNVEKNIKLATYASRCIENEILMHIRKKSKQTGEVSLDEPLNYDKDGNELLLSDILVYEGDSINKEMEKSSEKQILWEAIKKLNMREQQIMELRFGLTGQEESTQKEVADMLGISQSYISRIEKKILSRLKKDLAKTNIN